MRTGPIIGLHHQPYGKRNEHRHEKGEQKRPHRDGNFNHANFNPDSAVTTLQLPIPAQDALQRKRVGVLTGANSVL